MSLLCRFALAHLILANFVFLSSGDEVPRRDNKVCSITEEELQMMSSTINELYAKGKVKKLTGCSPLIAQTVSCANDLKSFVAGKIDESDAEYNRTHELLTHKESELIVRLNEVSEDFEGKYLTQINKITSAIELWKQRIDTLKIVKEGFLADLDYYTRYLNNGTEITSRFDFDSFFEKAKKCSFPRNAIENLITALNEIYVLTVGAPRNTPLSDCFEEMRHQMSSIESFVAHRTGESRIESLNSTYDARRRCIQKLIDDVTLEQQQQAQTSFSNLRDELQRLKLQHTNLKDENEILRKKTIAKGVEVIKQMIRSGEKYRKSRDLFIKIKKELSDPLKKVLDRTYDCNVDHLRSTIRFAEIFDMNQGFKIVVEKMKECGQIDSPFILKIAYETKDKALDGNVAKVYEGWSAQIKQGNTEQIEKFVELFPTKMLNFAKLFKLMMEENEKNSRHILRFIDKLHAYDQNIVTVLYDEIARSHVNSIEHIKIAEWIRDKLNWIESQPRHTVLTGDLQTYLDDLRQRLPKSIETFVFEPAVIIATQDHDYLLRSDSHNSVKFKVKADASGDFYRFEDLRFEKAFYAENYQDDASKTTQMRVRFGNGDDDKFYWKVIPTDNAEYFFMKNKANGFYLSADEDNVCTKKRWIGANSYEYMNRAYGSDAGSNVKWMFTSSIIRKGILPDRQSG